MRSKTSAETNIINQYLNIRDCYSTIGIHQQSIMHV